MRTSWLRWAVCAALMAGTVLAAPVNFSGTFTSDGDLALFNLTLATNGLINVNTFSYGGSALPLVASGGFAPSLGLYDLLTGSLVQNDFTGGVAAGPDCSPSGTKDPVTGFCEDAHLSFSATAGNYLLVLAVQPNNPPGQLGDLFLLAPGTNFSPGPFADPGDPTGATLRNGDWFVQIDLNGTAALASAVPEPATGGLLAAGMALVALWKRTRKS